ncbi:hypothetical protein OIT41_15740 [Arthrobacter sp. YA7-1]|nr:hypothetical protein [Arthrobacter sp. YA7-1]UYY80749.1 hypothetical protein OIT41_15740 [Arthrobacter sp. YA7-1]
MAFRELGDAGIVCRVGVDPALVGAAPFSALVLTAGNRFQMEWIRAVAALARPVIQFKAGLMPALE